MVKRRYTKVGRALRATPTANPTPDRPVSFHFDPDTNYLKWKRDLEDQMSSGHFVLARSSTYGGAYTAIYNIDNPTSGVWAQYQDSSYITGQEWYRLYAVNNYLNSSPYAFTHRKKVADWCKVTFTILRADGTPYVGDKRPIVRIIPEHTDLFKDSYAHDLYSDRKYPGVRVDEYSGMGVKEVIRSSVINDETYKIIVNIEDYEEIHRDVTIPDSVEVDLNDLIDFVAV